MTRLSRVVWSEGMPLAPHHFQAQSRYFEDSIQFALSQLFFKPYGLAGVELDVEALRNGTAALLHARGVMPDGLPFDLPASDSPPRPVDIRPLFSPTQDSHLLYLAIPPYRPDEANTATNGGHAGTTRYRMVPTPMRDDITGRDERPVDIGGKNFRLALDSDPATGEIRLPIARVRRDGAGHFIYDPSFVPPALFVGASAHLMSLLRRLLEVLEGKADSLARGRPGSVDEFARQEIASFWLLHAIDSSIPVLRHILQTKRARPEELYVELARLAGALCTFTLDAHPRSVPAFDHDRPGESFDLLEQQIRARLELVLPQSRVLLPLQRTEQSVYTATITDPRCLGPARWVLGVRASMSEGELATWVPQLVTVCAGKFTMGLVARGLPGLTLTHLPIPPGAISPRSDTQYFGIERSGRCWDLLATPRQFGLDASELSVHVPDAIANPELELAIVIES